MSDGDMWKALANKNRRDLLRFIGDKGIVSFTELKNYSRMKVGTLYHHLDALGPLLSQNADKQYYLTSKGEKAFNLIEEEIDINAARLMMTGPFSFVHSLLLRSLFKQIKKEPVKFFGFILLVFSGYVLLTQLSGIAPIFLFPSHIEPNYLAPILFVISTFVTYFLCQMIGIFFQRRKTGKLPLLQAIMLIQFPLILLSLIQWIVIDISYPQNPFSLELWFIVVLVFVQVVYIGLLIEALVVTKDLRVEKAGFIALVVVYILNVGAFLFMNGLGLF